MPAELPPHVDRAWHDPELAEAAGQLAAGEVDPALELLAATRDQIDRRELCTEILGQAGSGVVDQVRATVPSDADGLLLLGSCLIQAAWRARGAAYAPQTSPEQVAQLINLTAQARSTLRRAAKAAPEDVAPWCGLMQCALGAPAHEREGDEVFTQVQRRAPDIYGANATRLQMLAAKWYGSNDTMLQFARVRTADLVPGSPMLALLPAAHIELHIANMSSGNIFKRVWRSMTYLGKDQVRAEVTALSERLLAGTDTDRAHPRWQIANQVFAMFYAEAEKEEDKTRLAAHLANAGDHPAHWPWGYFGDHEERFTKAQKIVQP